MRIISLLLAVLFFRETKATSTHAPTFKHHTFEFSVTPAVDYYFITYPSRVSNFKSLTTNLCRPFAGCNFGFSYIYRPVKFIGISTGLNYLEYVSKAGKVLSNNSGGPNTQFVYFKGYFQSGYISAPILVHGYFRIKQTELDCSTGPEFFFPIYSITKATLSGAYTPIDQTQLYSPSQMRQYSYFGWDVAITASIPVKNSFYVSIGPEMKFIGVKPLEAGPYYSQLPHQIDYYTGIKVCFRLATDFAGKNSKSVKTSTPNK